MTSDNVETDPASKDDNDNSSRNRALLIAALVMLICAVAATTYWWFTRNLITTEDAFLHADIVQVAPRVSGTVAKVYVQNNAHVEAGDLLVKLDPTDFKVAVAQAEAQLAAAKATYHSRKQAVELAQATSETDIESARAALQSAQAQAELASKTLARYQKLYARDEISQQRFDKAQTKAKTAKAQVEKARAQLAKAKTAPQQIAVKKARAKTAAAQVEKAKAALEQAKLRLSYTKIRAPQSGHVTNKAILPGARVRTGQTMLAVVSEKPWVVANFKETQIARMEPGQPVEIEIDAYPEMTFHGHVQSIQHGTGSAFSLLPPQNATGNFVKVVQRVPVKIVFDHITKQDKLVLAPGLSVVPTVNVAAEGNSADKAQPDHG